MIRLEWNEKHGRILDDFLREMKRKQLRCFILRNYEGLPEKNQSKDVDIIVEPGSFKYARELLLKVYKNHGLENYDETIFDRVHCMLGMSVSEHFSIHLDLIEGYLSKGFEVFDFEELYANTVKYKEYRVLNPFFEGMMLLIYKLFGYKKPVLKKEYRDCIRKSYIRQPTLFKKTLASLTGEDLSSQIVLFIEREQFDKLTDLAPKFTAALRRNVWKIRPISTIRNRAAFYARKIERILIHYRRYARTFAVMAPDGAGKTTFLTELIKEMNFYYVNQPEEGRFHLYHFRPGLLPNLGAVGEAAGVMKQDTDFTVPHRGKTANPLSSFIRIAYYTADYCLGWQFCIRKDVQYDFFSVFDRYSYDLLVDPHRTKLNLPKTVRKFFVALTPKPQIVFFLKADPAVIYSRKQELTLEEINRQLKEYESLIASDQNRFIVIDAERESRFMAEQAAVVLLNRYTRRI